MNEGEDQQVPVTWGNHAKHYAQAVAEGGTPVRNHFSVVNLFVFQKVLCLQSKVSHKFIRLSVPLANLKSNKLQELEAFIMSVLPGQNRTC
jgi:hypothetical protein